MNTGTIRIVGALDDIGELEAGDHGLVVAAGELRVRVGGLTREAVKDLAPEFGNPFVITLRGLEHDERARLEHMNAQLRMILGRANFECGSIAALLRNAGGMPIARKAEDEQAAVILWTLQLYLQHGDDWATVASTRLRELADRV